MFRSASGSSETNVLDTSTVRCQVDPGAGGKGDQRSTPSDADATQSFHERLARAIEEITDALQQWEFKRHLRDGQPLWKARRKSCSDPDRMSLRPSSRDDPAVPEPRHEGLL